jgi:hypothetical protein
MSANARSRGGFQQKNPQCQHSKSVLVKWSFSRHLGGNVSHTRQGVVNVPQGLITASS